MVGNVSEVVYECQNLSFSYRQKDQVQPVCQSLNLSIWRGDFVCLSGPSGSGKSTLLNLLGLVEKPDDGDIQFVGRAIVGRSESDLNHMRRFEIGFVFQDFQLIDVLTVQENVEYFLTRQQIPRQERLATVEECLKSVGLWEQRAKRPTELSGGQKQRVAIARALAKRPAVIIADEPTASLDVGSGKALMGLLQELNQKYKVTIIVASHDQMVIAHCPRNIRLQDGRIIGDEVKQAC